MEFYLTKGIRLLSHFLELLPPYLLGIGYCLLQSQWLMVKPRSLTPHLGASVLRFVLHSQWFI